MAAAEVSKGFSWDEGEALDVKVVWGVWLEVEADDEELEEGERRPVRESQNWDIV